MSSLSPKSKRSILFVAQHIYPISGGGTGRYVYDAARHLARNDNEVDVVLPRAHAHEPASESIEAARVMRVGGSAYFTLKRLVPQTLLDMILLWWHVRKLLQTNHYDVIVFHHFPVTPLCLLLKRVRRTPHLYHFYASVYQEWRFEHAAAYTMPRRLFGWFVLLGERFTFRCMPHVITLSQESKRILTADFNVPAEKITVFRGAVDTEQFCKKTIGAGEKYWPQASSIPRLLTVRRLEKRMGLPMLIEAVALLHARGVPVQLVIAGKGELAEELQSLITDHGLQDYITLAGFVLDADLADLYVGADLFVLPTVALEGFGLATVEAMASGTIPVTTAIGSTPEIVGGVDERLMAASATAADLADALERVIILPAHEKQLLQQTCLAVAQEKYSWHTAALDLETIYENSLN